MTAYNYFVADKRGDIQKNMAENTTNAEVFAEVGKQWKELTDKKKSKYTKLAEKDQKRYEKEMKVYNANKTDKYF